MANQRQKETKSVIAVKNQPIGRELRVLQQHDSGIYIATTRSWLRQYEMQN